MFYSLCRQQCRKGSFTVWFKKFKESGAKLSWVGLVLLPAFAEWTSTKCPRWGKPSSARLMDMLIKKNNVQEEYFPLMRFPLTWSYQGCKRALGGQGCQDYWDLSLSSLPILHKMINSLGLSILSSVFAVSLDCRISDLNFRADAHLLWPWKSAAFRYVDGYSTSLTAKSLTWVKFLGLCALMKPYKLENVYFKIYFVLQPCT